MSRQRQWTEEEVEFLKQNYSMTPNKDLATKMNRGIASIFLKASRLGLVKNIEEDEEPINDFENYFSMISREEAKKLDKIDLLRVSWSLLEMYRRELNNTYLETEDRLKLMNAVSNHIAIINSAMKGSEDELGEEDDLKSRFVKIDFENNKTGVVPRRLRLGSTRTYRLVN